MVLKKGYSKKRGGEREQKKDSGYTSKSTLYRNTKHGYEYGIYINIVIISKYGQIKQNNMGVESLELDPNEGASGVGGEEGWGESY